MMMVGKSRRRVADVYIAIVFFFGVGSVQIAGQEPTISKTEVRKADVSPEWVVRRHDEAVARALDIVGLSEVVELTITARLVSLEADNTPFLYKQIVGRPVWHVVIANWKLKLERPSLRNVEDKYERTFDVFIDPENGNLLKIVSRWPQGVKRIPPEPGAVATTKQIAGGGEERYHAFPEESPPVKFLQALDGAAKGGGNPLIAEQIVGHYVVWSILGREPKPVWVITIRGTEAFYEASFPGVGVNARNHLRLMVDAKTGEFMSGDSSPQPEFDSVDNRENEEE